MIDIIAVVVSTAISITLYAFTKIAKKMIKDSDCRSSCTTSVNIGEEQQEEQEEERTTSPRHRRRYKR